MIKNFIYLDTDKLQSLSSQLFNGVTQYVLTESSSIKEGKKNDINKGIARESLIADILKQNNKESEKKFLDDYLYILFEEKLSEINKILDLNEIKLEINNIDFDKKFIKVKSKIIVNDIKRIINTFENINKFIKAASNVSTYEAKTNLEQFLSSNSITKEERTLAKQELNKILNQKVDTLDDKFLKDLIFLLNYGYEDQLEIQLKLNDKIISSNLKREYLREKEDLLVRKYSRFTEIEFTLLGIVTQSSNNFVLNEDIKIDTVKEALINVINHLSNIENEFTGRLHNEIVVDPIAVYYEL